MNRKPAAVLVSLVLTVLLAAAAPASARTDTFQKVSQASGELLTLTQQLTQGALLIALDVDKAGTMERLDEQAGLFEARLKVLRNEDEALGPAEQWPDTLVSQVEQIEFLWGQLRAVLQKARKSGEVTSGQVEAVANLDVLLQEAIRTYVESFKSNTRTVYYSLYNMTVDVARHQAVESQRMFKEFLFVAYQYQVPEHKKNLNESYSRLDCSFQALIHGDSELQLIPAPNADVERFWNEAREIWIEFRPIIKEAARNGTVNGEQITEVASRNLDLLAAMNTAVSAYRKE